MKGICLRVAIVFLGIIAGFQASAQLNITSAQQSGNWADYYVNNILLGAGVSAYNISFSGDSNQIGEFTQTNVGLGMPYGLAMATGDVALAIDTPNTNIDLTVGGGNNGASDPDLAILSGQAINDAAILEFDFVPQGDTIRFKYVFASEEYNNFVCSINDVFGFFLSGPGINGTFANNAVNVALIPGTNTQVGINTVNNGSGSWGVQPSACGSCPCNSTYFVDNTYPSVNPHISYDGMTTVLEAIYPVVCGDTYHIKLAIGDASDAVLDSGVFLEGGSFTSNVIEVAITSVNGDTTINEGCGQADIRFFRTDTTDTSITPLIISGTATNGTDYTFLPDSIMLLPGQADTVVSILPFFDNVPEGMEYLNIQAISINPCGDTFISEGTLYFYDIPNLNIQTNDTVFKCPSDSFTIHAEVLSGGPPPYSYTWSNGMTGPNITIPAIQQNGSDTLILTVQDSCALFSIHDTIVYFRDTEDPPSVSIFPNINVPCAGDTVQYVANTQLGNYPLEFLWSLGDTTDTVRYASPTNFNFYVTVTDSCGQTGIDTGSYNIIPYVSSKVAPLDTIVNCPGTVLDLQPDVLSGIGPQTFSWDKIDPVFDDSLNRQVQVNKDTLIYLHILDRCELTHKDSFELKIKEVDPLVATMEGAYLDCPGDEALFAPVVSGGLYPYRYEWNVSDTMDSVVVLYPEINTDIIVTVFDQCDRTDTAVALADVIVLPPMGIELSKTEGLCFGEETTLNITAQGGAGNYLYDWHVQTPPLSGEIYEEIQEGLYRIVPWQNTTHLLVVTDRCGNSMDTVVNLTVDPCIFISNVITPNGDGKNDAFIIPNIEAFPDAHLVVYNRWGRKVFEENPYRNTWEPVKESSGTYFYVLESEFFGPFRGSITIINDSKK